MDRLRKMEIFVTVVETGQFTRAASTLGLSKSAVSHAISDLETYLNFQFIRRGTKGVKLTAAGQDYYEQCCRILSDIQELEANVRDVKQVLQGSIRISAPVSFGAYILAPIIAKFSTLHPDINIQLDLTNRFIDLIEEGMDIGIRIANTVDTQLITQPLTRVQMHLCASPDYLARHEHVPDLVGLETLDCLKYSGTPTWQLIRDGQTHVFTPKGPIVSDSGEALREFAIAGKGVTYLPDFLMEAPAKAGSLVRVLPQYEGRALQAYIAFAPTRHRSQRVRRLVEYIAVAFEV
ncbi:MAG: LysR family transcriptional regulator [Robiginitomaculum sp.]|nr:MAG: LysR family transcriptional regulator [Robiginitomaculum sp.]